MTKATYVNSPNWNENKQKTRMWQGVDSGHHQCLFVIEDAEFWGRIRRKELLFEGLESTQSAVGFPNGGRIDQASQSATRVGVQ